MAQDFSGMSCSQLWYARNKIYADHGFCFKSDRAIRVFGAGCFPPFGRMSPAWKERVDDLQYWEARRGCPR
ncbi:MAG: YARHG domain-containing protein [Alphaproteobacteria bacterium]|nr:YARHG domain-containing protein [Alphaproteobacteria bacterium]